MNISLLRLLLYEDLIVLYFTKSEQTIFNISSSKSSLKDYRQASPHSILIGKVITKRGNSKYLTVILKTSGSRL